VRIEDPTEAASAAPLDEPSRAGPTVELRCGDCDHVLVVCTTPPECPECGGITWIRAAWHPFSALRDFPGSGPR
jgi:hypothetical protein